MAVLERGHYYLVHAKRVVGRHETYWVVGGQDSMQPPTYRPGPPPGQPWPRRHDTLGAIGARGDMAHP